MSEPVRVAQPPRLETLEPRLLLSADFLGMGDLDQASQDAGDGADAAPLAASWDLQTLASEGDDEDGGGLLETAQSSDGSPRLAPNALAPFPTVGGQDVLHILVDFDDMAGDPVSEAGAQDAFEDAGDFLSEASWGELWFENVDVTPTYRMPESTDYYADGRHVELMNDAVAAALNEDGYDVDDYWSFGVTFDSISGFGWAGLGYVGAPGIWLNGYGDSAEVAAHEFGHNLGAWHSALWSVSDGDPLSPGGTMIEYGDSFDIMGDAYTLFPDNHFNTYWKTQFGWMDAADNVVEVEEADTHRLYAHDAGEGTFVSDRTYALQIEMEEETYYWLEYRQAPYADQDDAGLEIRLSPNDMSDENTLLIDASGGTGDYALPFGETYIDEDLEMAITAVARGDDSGNWWIDVEVANTEVVTFADANLEQAVRDRLGIASDDITPDDMLDMTWLDSRSSNISDLSGLEYAKNLQVLYLDDNNISDLSPLSELTALTTLELSYNDISTLAPLESLTNLTYLDLRNSNISDVSSLSGLTNLSDLLLNFNNVEDVSPLANLGQLSWLELRDNSITAIDPLSEMFHLHLLDVRENYLNIASGSQTMQVIDGLEAESVDVLYDPQKQADLPEVTAFDAPTLTAAGDDPYAFTITYAGDIALDLDTITDNDAAVRITGPDNFEAFASFDSIVSNPDSSTAEVQYLLEARDGEWVDEHNGVYTIWAEADQIADAQGNLLEAVEVGIFEVEVDSTPPETDIMLTGVQGNAPWFISEVEVTLTASDELSDVDVIEYRLDAEDDWLVYDDSFIITAEGVTTIEYRATDTVGNVEPIQSADVHIDTQAPEATRSLIGDLGFSLWYTSAVEVVLSGSDQTSGVDRIEYRFDSQAGWAEYTGDLILDTTGIHALEYRAVDVAGNEGDVETTEVRVDVDSPTSSHAISSAGGTAPWYTDDVDITLDAKDDGSGVRRIEYRLDDGDWQVYEPGSTVTVSTAGVTTFSHRALDRAGNVEQTQTQTISIDMTYPVAELEDAGDITHHHSNPHAFIVTYSDDLAIDESSIEDNDDAIYVIAPDGSELAASFVSMKSGEGDHTRTALYQIDAPEGTWDIEDNGRYAVHLRDGEVYDMAGNAAAASMLGRFTVDVGLQLDFSSDLVRNIRFEDASGTEVRVQLTGGDGGLRLYGSGLAQRSQAHHGGDLVVSGSVVEVDRITLSGTSDRDQLIIRAGGGDGRVEIGEIVGDGALRQIVAPDAVLTGGGLVLDEGAVSRVLLGGLGDGASLTLPGEVPAVMLQLGAVGDDVHVEVASAIRQLHVTEWLGGSLLAPSVNALIARGDSGDFNADLTLTDLDVRQTLGYARIFGDIDDAAWFIAGSTGAIIAGDATDWTLAAGDLRTLRLGQLTDSSVNAHSVGALRAAAWQGGELKAYSMRSLVMHGDADVDGDFHADLHLTGDGSPRLLNAANIRGSIADAEWKIDGAVGVIRAGDVDAWELEAGDVRALQLGQVTSTMVSADEVGVVRVTEWDGGGVAADSLRSLLVRGDRGADLAGDFHADLALAGAETGLTLGNARVAGAVMNVGWSINGDAGVIVTGDVEDWAMVVEDLRLLNVGMVSNAAIQADTIRVVRAVAWQDSALVADSVQVLQVRGDARADVSGDFSGTLTLQGNGSGHALGRAMIADTLADAHWSIDGSMGMLRAGSIGDDVDGFTLGAHGDVARIVADEVDNAALSMANLRMMNVRGDLSGSEIGINDDVTSGHSLGRVIVRGGIDQTTIHSAGSVGRVVAQSLHDSDLFVGLPSNQDELPTDSSTFVNHSASLGGLIVRGVRGDDAPAFANSQVAASDLGRVNLGVVDVDAAGPAGVAGQSLTQLNYERPDGSRVRGSHFAPGEYDDDQFMVRIL